MKIEELIIGQAGECDTDQVLKVKTVIGIVTSKDVERRRVRIVTDDKDQFDVAESLVLRTVQQAA